MKLLSIYLFVFLGTISLCFSQGANKVTGLVKASDGKPLPFANVLMLASKDSTIITGGITNENGEYTIEGVKEGDYYIAVSIIGFKKVYSSKIHVDNSASFMKVEPLILAEEISQLKEVEIVTRKPLFEQEIDKLIVNVANSITSIGGNALDILSRSPGISLNRQTNSLSMNGKKGIMVMINGKQSRLPMAGILQMLNGMNADNIEKIELITNPSAKYDAQGDAGIINIVLKKNENYGTNGSYTISAGCGFYEKLNGSINANHKTSKINIFGNYSSDYNRTWSEFLDSRVVNYEESGTLLNTNIISNRRPIFFTNNARLGVEFTPSEKTTFGFLATGFDNNLEVNAKNSSLIHSKDSTTKIAITDHEINHWQHLMGNFNITHAFSKKRDISFDLDYLIYNNNNPHQYSNNYYFQEEDFEKNELIRVSKKTPINIWVGKGDYTQSIGAKSKIEFGAKSSISRLKNDVNVLRNLSGIWESDVNFTQDYFLIEDVGAAYSSFNTLLAEKIKLQMGIRAEYTHMQLNKSDNLIVFNRKFWNLFPTLFLSRDLNKTNKVQVSYGRRITRPSFTDIAPFVVFSDPNTFYSGNPNLRPTITDAIQGTLKLRKEFMVSIKYSHDKNQIASYQTKTDPNTNRALFYSSNIDNVNVYSANVAFPLIISNWWRIQSNIMGLYQQLNTKIEGEKIRKSQISGQLNITQVFTLPKKLTGELNFFYLTPSRSGLSKMHSFSNLTLAIQKKLPNEKGSISLSMSDILWTAKYTTEYNTPQLNNNAVSKARFEPRIIRLSYSRSFGNKNIKGAKHQTTGSDSERKRVNTR